VVMSLSAPIGAATPLVNRWVAKKRSPTYNCWALQRQPTV